MTPEAFQSWCDRMGLTLRGAAEALGLSYDTARSYWFGVSMEDAKTPVSIPPAVVAACENFAHRVGDPVLTYRPHGGFLEGRTRLLREELVALFPAFEQHLGSSGRLDGDAPLTPHGLCSEFSSYYMLGYETLSVDQRVAIFDLFEIIVAADPNDFDLLANAILTCFFENLADSTAGEVSRPLMGPKTRAFFEGWHVAPTG
jgi:hypothetical protein